MYVKGPLIQVESWIQHWYNFNPEKNSTLYYTFPFADSPECAGWDEFENIQMNIRHSNYPENLIVSFKFTKTEPDFPVMEKWPGAEDGYWYLVAHKL